MRFVFDETRQMLAETTTRFVTEQATISETRKLRDAGKAYDATTWKALVELGIAGLTIPESYGGSGLGMKELCVVQEALGRELVPSPLEASTLLAARALQRAGSDAQRKCWLPAIAQGEILGLAYAEAHSRYDIEAIEARAQRVEGGWALTGEKVHVLQGTEAVAMIVSAQTSEGITLFVVGADAKGLTRHPESRIDHRGAARITLEEVCVDETAVLGAVHGGATILAEVIDHATVGLSAAMLGGAQRAFERTLDYLKTREQFGVTIDQFQALQHRAARLFVELELARTAVLAAAAAVDEQAPELGRWVSLAKTRCNDVYLHVAEEAVQLHGGIGMTDEHDIGFYLKASRCAAATFGDSRWHRRRWAKLGGY